MRHNVLRTISCFGMMICLGQLVALPAAAQHCTDSTVPGTLIGFTPLSGVIEKPNSCNLLPCYKPEEDGGAYPATDENCDGLSGPCPVQLRVPLKFPGNSQMPTNTHVRVYWFDQAMPDEGACLPPPLGNCSPISICGPLGAEILVDKGETWIQVAASCASIASGQYTGGTFSVSAYACQTFSGECTERLDVPGLVLPSPEEAWDLLGCDPPPPRCDACVCDISGGPPRGGPAKDGPGALLRYTGRGAGHPGFPGSTEWIVALGRYWSHDYAERIVTDPDEGHVWLITRDAAFVEFGDLQNGEYRSVMPSDEDRRLLRISGGWELRSLDGTVQSFDAAGLWLQTVDRYGNTTLASYTAGVLASVAFADGRRETFQYDTNGKLESITEVGVGGGSSRTWGYTWAGEDLVRIDRPDTTAWTFRYDDPRHPGYMTRMTLVGTDGSQRVTEAWESDEWGNVVRNWKGDASFSGTGAVEKRSFSYDNPFRPTETQVTDGLGNATTYELGRDPGGTKARIERTSGGCATCGGGPDSQMLYDDPAHPLRATRRIDARGTVTFFEYNEHGRPTSRTDALGTSMERTVSWEYDPTYPSRLRSIEQPSASGSGTRRLSFTYDDPGRTVVRTEEGVENGSAFRYETVTLESPAGLPVSIDPPGYGVQDRTVLSYDPSRGGLLASTQTDPLFGTTSFGYDPFNRQTSITDPNGLTVETTYDELDRAVTVTEKGASAGQDLVTTHTYTVFGDLHRTIFPEGNLVEYGYDSAGRLVSIERKGDPATPGERTLFTLNDRGQRVREELQSWNGSGWQMESSTDFLFSSGCSLDKVVHADGSVTEYGYDCNGNLEEVWDPRHPSNGGQNPASKVFAYDVFNRLESVRRPWGGAGGGSVVTSYEWDVQDHLVKVIDANATVSRYVWSDRDLLIEEVSEVSGTTKRFYDEHGRLGRTEDARGQTVEHVRDAADRVLLVDFPGSDLDVVYTYDDPAVPFSKGRLTAVSRHGEAIDYRYDRFGRLTQDGTLSFTYDRNGNRLAINYPGGVTAFYTYDFADREASLSIQDGAGAPQAIVTQGLYKPSGPLTGLTLGNGLSEIRPFDSRYLPTAIQVPGRMEWSLSTDAAGNVLSIVDALQPGDDRSFVYQDYQGYLIRGDGPWGARAWSWDPAGNRLTQERDGVVTTYGYRPNTAGGRSPQLADTQEAGAAEVIRYFYDPEGGLTQVTGAALKARFNYDASHQLSQIRQDHDGELQAVTALGYDGRSFLRSSTQTRFDTLPATTWTTRSTYDSSAVLRHRVIERPATAGSQRDGGSVRGEDFLFYLAGRPVALLSKRETTRPGEVATSTAVLLYLSVDHLGTPVLATDTSGDTVWAGGFEPFGSDDGGARQAGVFLRFPGQWNDATWQGLAAETELYYNVNRWYGPATGTYTRPDPLGLPRASVRGLLETRGRSGGVGSGEDIRWYGYGGANPLMYVDPLGLRIVGFQGCSAAEQRQIQTAAEAADAASDHPCFCGYPKQDFRQRVRDLRVKCVPWTNEPLTGIASCGAAAEWDPSTMTVIHHTDTILLTPAGLTNPDCGCLQGTIMHEVLHLIGLSHDDGAGGFNATKRCFSCD